MRCPSCGTDNEAGRKFCHECGTRLVSGCPSCGATNAPSAKFCGECGTALAGDAALPPSLAEAILTTTERRVVSVLFADLVGFTTLAEGRDAEEVRELQDRYFATARAVVDRYGGTLEKFIGDAVMAVWGAPTGHEDDAERAVRAALELLSAVGALRVSPDGPALQARAAVMTGEAAVTIGATDQGLVSGDLVNTASRLQGVAPGGAVLVDEPTHRATAAAIAAEPVGEQDLRGRSAPVPAWRALHTLAMVRGRGRSEQLEPPFVGRDAELRLLKDILHAVDDERRARLVSVTGIAGIGKSRLAWELEKYVDGIVDDVYWHQGRSPAYGEGIAFWALAEMVRGRAGIAEGEPVDVAQAKLSAALEEYVPDQAERRAMAPWLMALLGYADPGDSRQDEAFAAARGLLERIADRGLVVLVFEDLQWADTGLIEFIESILEWSRSHRILIITLARPELLERRPTWGAGQRNFTALHLDPLPDDAMTRLLGGVVPGLPSALGRRIVERAAGVPLFAVETVRMLIDEGQLVREDDGYRVVGDVGELAVPESLRGLLAARLDALPAEDRTLLQDASVLGLTFTVDALLVVSTRPVNDVIARLRTLVRREILSLDEQPQSPERGQYAFVQGPMREVAYETLAKRERRSRHLAAARYFETLDSDELAGILASHYLDAYRATPEGPEADALAAQARVALRGAAERAVGLGSYDLALGYLEKALTVTTEPAERATLWEAATNAAHHAGRVEVSERYGRQAVGWYREAGDPIGEARAVVLLVQPMFEIGMTTEANELLEATLAVCVGLEDRPEAVRVVAESARALMQNNDPRAMEVADRALIAAERLEAIPIIAEALVTKAGSLDTFGRRHEGLALVRGAIELAVAHRLTSTEFRARSNYANQLLLDDPRASLAAVVDVRELARRLGAKDQFRWSTWQCYSGGFALGLWDWLLELADETEAGDVEPQDLEGIHETRASVAAYRGDLETAARERAVADRYAPDSSRPDFVAGRHALRAEILALGGQLAEAYDEAMTAARLVPFVWPSGIAAHFAIWMNDPERTRVAVELSRESPERGAYTEAIRMVVEAGLAALEGRRDEAIAQYRTAGDAFRRLELPFELGRCQLEYASLVGPADPGARAAADEARAILTRLGSPPLLERLEIGLARWASADVSHRQAVGTAAPMEAAGTATTEAAGAGDRKQT